MPVVLGTGRMTEQARGRIIAPSQGRPGERACPKHPEGSPFSLDSAELDATEGAGKACHRGGRARGWFPPRGADRGGEHIPGTTRVLPLSLECEELNAFRWAEMNVLEWAERNAPEGAARDHDRGGSKHDCRLDPWTEGGGHISRIIRSRARPCLG